MKLKRVTALLTAALMLQSVALPTTSFASELISEDTFIDEVPAADLDTNLIEDTAAAPDNSAAAPATTDPETPDAISPDAISQEISSQDPISPEELLSSSLGGYSTEVDTGGHETYEASVSGSYPHSAHPYDPDTYETYTFTAPGALKLKIKFDSDSRLDDGSDWLKIYDKWGKEADLLTNRDFRNSNLTVVKGDTIKFVFESDDYDEYWGWAITDIIATYVKHEWVEDSRIEPTCTEKGSVTHTCSICDLTLTEEIPMLYHNFVTDPAVDSTCTQEGHTEGKYCSRCGIVWVESQVIPKKDHKVVRYIDALAPTCTEEGHTYGTKCTECNNIIKPSTPIAPTGHSFVTDEGIPATCTQSGISDGSHCKVCGYVNVEQQAIPAQGHDEVEDLAVEPTCTEPGLTAGKHCRVCGEVLVKQEVVEALGHTEVTDEAVEATCTSTGKTEGSHCSVCGEVFTEQEEVPMLDHTWGEWTTTLQPTSFKEGEEERTCTVCGEKETRAIEKYNDGLFDDVRDPSTYYFKPVYWAVENGITKGYAEDNTFRPQDNCTRGQMVVFLYRLAGSPRPKTTKNPFVDISSKDYYYKAVLWAVENGITKGYSEDNTFRPNEACQREHAVMFLWRFAGKPSPKSSRNQFTDISSKDYFYQAALWASEKGIAKGYNQPDGTVTYGPKNDCQREHIVTFLYRFNRI